MKIVIIEDERLTAEDLRQTLLDTDPTIEILAALKSVSEGKEWFRSNPLPDLIFSDIELGDGLSFEILDGLTVPVIFCTAYNEYALNAFESNGIAYILKPFTLTSVTAALKKFKNLTQVRQEEMERHYELMRQIFARTRPAKASSLLIHFKYTIYPVKIEDIALFRMEHEMVSCMMFDKTTHYPGKTLEELEMIAGGDFFRVNRQYLVSRKAIINVSSLLSRKLSLSLTVPVKEGITISREKSPLFLKWLSGIGT